MGSKTRAPAVPDYTAAAEKQGAEAKEAWQSNLQANRPNQVNQYGSSSWTQDDKGNWTQTTALNPQQQAIFDAQQGNQLGIAGMQSKAMNGFDTSQIDFSKAPGMPGGPVDYASLGQVPGRVDYSSLGDIPQVGQYNQQATDLYNNLAQPGLDRQAAARRAALAAQGISDSTSRAGTNMESQLGDMFSRSGMMGAQAGIEQGNKMFGQGMERYKQGVSNLNSNYDQDMANYGIRSGQLEGQWDQQMGLHNQGTKDILSQRGANLEQLTGLMGLGSEVGTPQFENFYTGGAYDTPDRVGALGKTYDAQLNTTNARNADSSNKRSTIGTIANIGASIAF